MNITVTFRYSLKYTRQFILDRRLVTFASFNEFVKRLGPRRVRFKVNNVFPNESGEDRPRTYLSAARYLPGPRVDPRPGNYTV